LVPQKLASLPFSAGSLVSSFFESIDSPQPRRICAITCRFLNEGISQSACNAKAGAITGHTDGRIFTLKSVRGALIGG
jgi:hypothetical protein